MKHTISTLLAIGLSVCISPAIANTTDLILKANVSYSESGEAAILNTNKGTFYVQWMALPKADNAVLDKAKKGSCLAVRTEGVLTTESDFQSIKNCKKANTPNFSDYPAEQFTGQRRIPITGEFKDMRGQMVKLAKQPIDYAGQYVTGGWGCGAGCYVPVILNVKTGSAQGLNNISPNLVEMQVECKGMTAGIETKANSRLMIITGAHLTGPYDGEPVVCTKQYFVEKDGKLGLIK